MKHPYLQASLRDHIQAWADKMCESDEAQQSEIYWGNETVEHMTTAAFAVFLGIAEAQKYERNNA